MDTILLQDWTTIGATSGLTLTQAAPEWLDLAPYQDVIIYVEARVSGGLTFYLETAPARDERLFTAVGSAIGNAPLSKTIPVQVGDSPSVPLSRWLRWRVTSTATGWTGTFRITLMVNRQGR